jgi:hypothetical protein
MREWWDKRERQDRRDVHAGAPELREWERRDRHDQNYSTRPSQFQTSAFPTGQSKHCGECHWRSRRWASPNCTVPQMGYTVLYRPFLSSSLPALPSVQADAGIPRHHWLHTPGIPTLISATYFPLCRLCRAMWPMLAVPPGSAGSTVLPPAWSASAH